MVEVAKALGGSFKLVTLAPRTESEMTQLLRVVVSKMTYTVSSGTLNSTMPHHSQTIEKQTGENVFQDSSYTVDRPLTEQAQTVPPSLPVSFNPRLAARPSPTTTVLKSRNRLQQQQLLYTTVIQTD